MSYSSQWAGSRSGQYSDAYASDGREPGARRKKLAGYLRAANELRQTYAQSYKEAWSARRGFDDEASDMPGAFPGASMTNNGDEQLVIFPSYARRHVKRSTNPDRNPSVSTTGSATRADDSDTIGDQDFWQREWDNYEDDNAIVDVDVRGWIYAPHRGPPTRKHRLLVGLARQLSGISAPRQSPSSSNDNSRASSPTRFTDRLDAPTSRQEQELARKEADNILRRGEAEAQIAGQGAYSESPSERPSASRYTSSPSSSRASSPAPSQNGPSRARLGNRLDDSSFKPPQRQGTWSTSNEMTQAELVVANNHLLSRLQPFLANPLCNIPISAFFYNETVSRQKSVETDASGHFALRAALDFVPTHVRILASERLSVTEKVSVTEPKGVSVISDIDDTIKHSGISSGAKEIFKNVFVRELEGLSIKGVNTWYNKLAEMGCIFHYVSNSPWQLYPVLTSFFSAAGLPPGSFHLKQYSGMLQGIFEPVAERKKSTLDKILVDFPERRFILVGDSGEADLEVYTDVVQENPGRILGVFIRDVTTSARQRFFDSAQGLTSAKKSPGLHSDGLGYSKAFPTPDDAGWNDDENDPYFKEAIRRSLVDQDKPNPQSDHARDRPALPPRRPTAPAAPEENLIDLDFGDEPGFERESKENRQKLPEEWLKPPPRPVKPRSLSSQPIEKENGSSKTPPPRPRKPSTSVQVAQSASRIPHSSSDEVESLPSKPRPDPLLPRLARRPLNGHSKPSDTVPGNSTDPSQDHNRNTASRQHEDSSGSLNSDPPPPLPRRKPQTNNLGQGRSATVPFRPAPVTQEAGANADSTNNISSSSNYWGSNQDAQMSRKEEAWMRRWARAKDVLSTRGVMLRSWRVGEDVQGDAIALVERALRQESKK